MIEINNVGLKKTLLQQGISEQVFNVNLVIRVKIKESLESDLSFIYAKSQPNLHGYYALKCKISTTQMFPSTN